MSDTTAIAPELAAFLLQNEARIEISLPNGNPMLYQGAQVAVVVHGPSTDEFARAQAKREKAVTTQVFAAAAKSKKPGKGQAQDGSQEIDVQFLCDITKHVENLPWPGGVAAMYRNLGLQYLNRQVLAHVNDLGNFFPASETN